jgi:outer membrane receptor protein involved in Fe transport
MKQRLIVFFTTFFLSINISAFSQMQQMMQKGMTAGRVYGKVLDAKTNKPVEFAAVQISNFKKDSTGAMRENIINGQLTQANGDFSLDQLPVFGELTFKVSAMGYKMYEQKVKFDIKMPQSSGQNQMSSWQQALNSIDKDLGNIKLESNAVALKEVQIDGSLPVLELRPDKKVYNVDKNPTVTGGTAEDVLKNVPSVNVDIDGNVTLRNAAPQIFVDGRPTTLTVDQIPADAIQDIEIITNPSAKYDASGGMAGILNIVLKKNRRIGYNGMLRAGVDSRGRANLGADFNVREGKVNVFVSGNLNQRKSKGTGLTERYTRNEGVEPLMITQNNKNTSNGFFGFLRSGVDIFLDNRNTITVSGMYMNGQMKPTDYLQTQTDTLFDNSAVNSGLSIRNSDSKRNFKNRGASVAYKHLFPKEGQEWTADINFNSMTSNMSGNYKTQNYFSDMTESGLPVQQNQQIEGDNTMLTAQSDMVIPMRNKSKIETGVRGAMRDYTSVNQNFIFNNISQEFMLIPNLTANYKYIDQVYAAYVTYSQQIKKFNYQAGLRAESSFYEGELTQTKQKFKTDYPVSLFPSASASYKLNDKNDLQINYSRRINRPNFFQIIPYTDYSDSLNISKGNPGLKPEFTHSVELSMMHTFSRKNTLLGSVYYKRTENVITRYLEYDFDTILDKSVLVSTFRNATSSYAYGLELTAQNNIQGWLDITSNFNAYQSVIDGKNIENNLTNEQFSWFAKLNLDFKLPKNFSLNVSGSYQSKMALQITNSGGWGGGYMGGTQNTAQGYVRPNYGVDAGIKYVFLKDKSASLTLNVSDIFKTRINDVHSESTFYTQDSWRKRDAQIFRLNFSYRFGKFDTSLFKRKNLQMNTDSMPDIGM